MAQEGVEELKDFEELEDHGEEPMSDEDDDGLDYEETAEDRKEQYGLEMATMIFDRHDDSVFVSRTSPDGKHIASGGQDDRGFMFDMDGNLELAFIGHKESVTGIAWNFDSSLVASSDLSGLVKIWNVDTKKCVFECDEGEVEYCQFHPKAKTYILTALAGGTMYFYNIKDGNFKILSGPVGVRCVAGEFLADGTQYLIAYEDASIRLFDLKSTEVITALQVKLNELVSMAVSPCQTYLIVGSSNACLATIILKEQTLKVVLQRKADDLIDSDHPIEAVDIYRDCSLCAVASLSGFVYVYEKEKLRLKLLHPDGVTKVMFLPGEDLKPRIISSCLDGKLRIWDCRSGEELITLHGHTDHILDTSLTGYNLTTTSDDKTVRYWNLKELEEREEGEQKGDEME